VGNTPAMWKQVAFVVAIALLAGGAAQGARKAAPANTSLPTISGTVREAETLSATSGSWSGSTPMSFSYRWQRCNSGGGKCDNIAGATSQTYKLSHGDVGHTLRVSVTASNSDGSANAVSNATAVVDKGQQPVNTAAPTIAGTAKAGQTLTAVNGTWTNNPTSFRYQWRRCNTSGSDCKDVGSNRQTYGLDQQDVGSTIRVDVKATNAFGGNTATSAATAVVAPRGPLPASTAPPAISGLAQEGQTLSASVGSWTNGPTRFTYRWLRCDSAGNNCGTLGSAPTQRLTSADVGHRIRVSVTAANQYGSSGAATSVPTAVVASSLPGGAVRLSNGQISLPVETVLPPQRLIITRVAFAPTRLHTRAAFIGRFRVTDTRGYVIRGALVYAIGLPYSWVRSAPEVITATDGWATIQFFPTSRMPLRRAALVFFVRARKGGDNLLAGVSTRRLVQVGIG
jgi:hypothetical protein